MNLKLKHILILSISFCVFVFFVDKYYSTSPRDDSIHSADDEGASAKKTRSVDVDVRTEGESASKRLSNNATRIEGQKDTNGISVDASEPEDVRGVAETRVEQSDALPQQQQQPQAETRSESMAPHGIHVVMVLKDAAINSKLQRKFDITIASIFQHSRFRQTKLEAPHYCTVLILDLLVLYCYRYIICIFSVSIHWHVFGDDKSLNFAQKALDQGFSSLPYDRRQKFSSEIDLHDLDEVEKKISAQVEILMKYFTGTIC